METIKIKQETLLNLLEYINEKEWVTLKDKEGEPYHVKIEKSDTKDEDKKEKTVEEIKQDYIDGKISAKEAEKLLPKDTDTTSLAIAKYNKEHGIKDFDFDDKKQSDTKDKQSDLKVDKKEKYKLKEGSKVTQKRFDNLFDNGSYLENHQFRKTIVLDNIHQVEYDKKRGLITFYELGDLSEDKDYSSAPKGTLAMLPKFRTDDYNKLVDYLFKTNQEWRLDRNKGN